jgi:hypothetical protein
VIPVQHCWMQVHKYVGGQTVQITEKKIDLQKEK